MGTGWVLVDLASSQQSPRGDRLASAGDLVASAGLPGSPPAACPVSRGLHLQLFTVTQDPPPGGDIVRIMGLVPLAPWWPRTSWLFLHSERTGDEKGRWDQGTGYVTE